MGACLATRLRAIAQVRLAGIRASDQLLLVEHDRRIAAIELELEHIRITRVPDGANESNREANKYRLFLFLFAISDEVRPASLLSSVRKWRDAMAC